MKRHINTLAALLQQPPFRRPIAQQPPFRQCQLPAAPALAAALLPAAPALAVLAAALLLAACTEAPEAEATAAGTPVSVSATAVGTAAAAMTPTTRAAHDVNTAALTAGDQFYARLTGTTVDATTYTTADGGATTPMVQPYLRQGTAAADAKIWAYYPWRISGSDGAPNAGPTLSAWTVALDQSTSEGYRQSDLMYADDATITAATGQAALTFHHRMAKIIVKIDNQTRATIQTVNLVQGCRTVDIATPATLTPGTTVSDPVSQQEPLVMATEAPTADGCAALLPPQTIEGQRRFIEIVTDQGPAYFALAADQDLTANTEYTATVTLDRADIGATTTVTAWTAGTAPTYEELPHLDITVGGQTMRMVYVQGGDNIQIPARDRLTGPDVLADATHYITTSRLSDYYIGQSKVNEAFYNAVMGLGTTYTNGAKYAKYNVTMADVYAFCKTLNQQTAGQRPAGYSFRLPSEVQWTYAAQGGQYKTGSGHTWPGTSTEADVPQYCYFGEDKELRLLHANELGLYDMGGSGWERCLDKWHVMESADISAATAGADYVAIDNSVTDAANMKFVFKSSSSFGQTNMGRCEARCQAGPSGGGDFAFRLALSKDVERISVTYPLWTAASADTQPLPLAQYDERDRFGLYIVNEAGAIDHANLPVGLKAGSLTELDLEPLRQQGIGLSTTARYFLYYPYRPTPGTTTATGTTADAFFSGFAWTPATDQSTLARLRAEDLQTGASVPTASRTDITIEMAHKQAMAVLAMGAATTSSHLYRVLDANTTTTKYSSAATANAFYALDEFLDGTPQPFRTGQRNTAALRCYYICKASTATTLQCAYRYGSTPQWADVSYTITAGQYTKQTTAAPAFKNLARVYTNTTASTARSSLTGLENGTVQAYTLPFATADCAYQIECWGAQGGNMVSSTYNGRGGLGGYVSGITTPKLNMQAGQNLYVYCGGCGIGWNSTADNYGGWNGGGSCTAGACGGGGASDVRTVNAAWDDNVGLHARLIVAGGGGGANDYRYSTSANDGEGGYGGKTGGSNRLTNGTTETVSISGTYGKGATQTEAGALGSFGKGGEQLGTDGGGGGGGWYGGGKGGNSYMSGGGGSSYIRPAYFTNATYINGGTQNVPTTMPNPNAANGTNMTSTYNDASGGNGSRTNQYNWRGFVRITCLPYMKP